VTPAFAAAGPSAYWYLARGTGAVSLVLLSASVVIGVLGAVRFAAAPRWPRFAIDGLHRDISLLAVALLVVHIATSVIDAFAPIRLIDAVIPFVSSYRPLWMGLGAVAFDLMIALVLTSFLRRQIGYRGWRAVHWFAYLSWPVAVLHGLGTGSDTRAWWMLALTAACVASVLAAVFIRVARAESGPPALRGAASALAIVTPIGLVLFTLAGPLQRGWAGRAGTPSNLLATAGTPAPRSVATPPAASPATAADSLDRGFSATVTGTVTETQARNGAIVDLTLQLSGDVRGRLRVRMGGVPLDGGGLSMTGSQVDLAAVGHRSVLQGRILDLQGQQFTARVSDRTGSVLDLNANLNIDGSRVTGTLLGTPPGQGG